MRRVLHIILVCMAAPVWTLGVLIATLCLILVMLADKVWPEATWGNCWSFVGPRWFKQGGYLVIRYADDVRIFGKIRIPHALWMKSINNADIEHIAPIHRSKSTVVPWRTIYFPFLIRNVERPHNATTSVSILKN